MAPENTAALMYLEHQHQARRAELDTAGKSSFLLFSSYWPLADELIQLDCPFGKPFVFAAQYGVEEHVIGGIDSLGNYFVVEATIKSNRFILMESIKHTCSSPAMVRSFGILKTKAIELANAHGRVTSSHWVAKTKDSEAFAAELYYNFGGVAVKDVTKGPQCGVQWQPAISGLLQFSHTMPNGVLVEAEIKNQGGWKLFSRMDGSLINVEKFASKASALARLEELKNKLWRLSLKNSTPTLRHQFLEAHWKLEQTLQQLAWSMIRRITFTRIGRALGLPSPPDMLV